MNKRERVMAAVQFRPVDKLPMDFSACDVVLNRLYKYCGVSSYKELLHYLDCDIVDIRGVVDPKWVAPFPHTFTREDGMIQNYLGFVKKIQNTVFGPVPEHSDYILQDCLDLDEIKEAWQFPRVEWFDFSDMSERIREYQQDGFAIMASGGSVFQHPTLIRRMDVFLCDLMTEPEIAEYLMDGYTNFYLDYYRALFEACPGQIDIFRIADDLGMQDRPLIGENLFRQFIFPRLKKLCDLAHEYGVKVMFHSCGCAFPFIGMLIEAGVDILDPLQPNAKDMSPENLHAHYAGKICFHGSIDTQYTLPKGTEEDVRSQVRKHAEIFTKGGSSFIIAPAHQLQPDVPVENIIALYDEARRFPMP